MPRRQKEWCVHPHEAEAIRHLAKAANISPIVAQLLANRGILDAAEAKRFLDASLVQLHEPATLPGVNEAAARLWKAIQTREKVCVFGDYDADGVTGTAVLVGLIQKLGGICEFYIPHRLEEGYGLNREALAARHAGGATLLVTVDCGITACEEAKAAKELGLDLIITDHHEYKDEIPEALAIVHPRKPGHDYPFAGLSGSGVAFKLAWAVAQLASGTSKVTPELREFLQDAVGVAALGLIADVVPLRGENRVFVRHGLSRLAAKPTMGLKALIDVSQLKNNHVASEDVSFRLAPRLNAAGRLGCAMLVVELLTTTNPARARELAMALDGFNTQRQTLERRIATQAKEMVEASGFHEQPAIVLASKEWHAGVVGIVASRLVDTYGRPVVLVALKDGDEVCTGSGRSVPGFELHQALKQCEHHLEGFGGHAMAAGVRLRPANLSAFRESFCAAAAGMKLGVHRLMLDTEVTLASMSLGLLKEIDRLEPFGAENQRPRFLATNVTVEGPPKKVGQGERHVSLRFRQGNTTMRAIAFGQAERYDELSTERARFDIAFTPRENEWQGYRNVQLEIADFRPHHPA